MAEYKPGSMDIRTQEKTFEGFVRFLAWGGVVSVLVLIFLALANG